MRKETLKERFMDDNQGQLSVNIVWVVVGMLIAVAIGGLVFSEVNQAIEPESGTIGENVQEDVESGAQTIFPLLVVIVIVAVIIAIMKLFGGI